MCYWLVTARRPSARRPGADRNTRPSHLEVTVLPLNGITHVTPMARRRLLSVWVVLAAAAVAAAAVQDQGPYAERPPLLSPNTPCRMNLNNYTLSTCGLPLFLANFQVSKVWSGGRHRPEVSLFTPLFLAPSFQGYYACNKSVKIGRPASVEQLQAIVATFPRVRGAGVGHSWRAGNAAFNRMSAPGNAMSE